MARLMYERMPGYANHLGLYAEETGSRGEASCNRDPGGTGLGLGIARNVARAHGGDLVLRNRPEGGLEAILTLARDRASTAMAQGRSGKDGRPGGHGSD